MAPGVGWNLCRQENDTPVLTPTARPRLSQAQAPQNQVDGDPRIPRNATHGDGGDARGRLLQVSEM